MQFSHDGKIRKHTEQNIRHGRTDGGDDDSAFAADLVHEWTVDQKGKSIDGRADGEDGAELLLGHQAAERVFGDVEIVAAHVEERIGHAERKPVDETAEHEPTAVLERIVAEILEDDGGQAQRDQQVGMVKNERADRKSTRLNS